MPILLSGQTLIEEAAGLYREGYSAIQVKYALERPYQSYRDRLLNIAFSAFNFLRPKGHRRLGLSAGLLGNGFAISKKLLLSVPFQEHSLVEDIAYHLQLVKAGQSVLFTEKSAVYAKPAPSSYSFDIQRTRWEGGRLRLLVTQFFPLLQGIFQGNFRLIEPLLDLLLLPIGYHTFLLILLLFIPIWGLKIFGLFGLAMVALHALTAIRLTRGGWKDYLALLYSPIYVIEKLSFLGNIVKGASKNEWENTPREK